MDTQTTTEVLKEISERYELYRDIVKIGLGALIGASASLVTVFLKNKHELTKIEKEYNSQTNKHKLEIKVRILEEVIELVNEYSKESYDFFNGIYKLRKLNKYYKDLELEKKEKLLLNRDKFISSRLGIVKATRKLEMIGAKDISKTLDNFLDDSLKKRNSIISNQIKIKFNDEEWNEFMKDFTNFNSGFKQKINKFFIELK